MNCDLSNWQDFMPYLNNILNEVVNGFHVDAEKQFGVHEAELAALLEKVQHIHTEQLLTSDEARLLILVAHVCDVELGEDEFHTRTGYTLEESQQAQDRLARIAQKPSYASAS